MRLAVAAQAADLASFAVLMSLVGAEAEANPLVRSAVEHGLLGLVVTAKLLLMASLALWPYAVGRWTGAIGACAVCAGLVGAGSNITALLP